MDLLYFAWVRERIGTGHEQVDPPAEVASVGELIAWLAQRSPGHAEAFAEPSRLRAAIDQRFVPLETPLGNPREIAIFPPVTGG
ncbi:molybdopterin converting factor subunit 1 [Sphingomonas sp. MMS12-HWE2-04]|uniref:molybdopterin converting factor subunit 1 n=1 Tax=Sphingomonas sp. MMS12-HWE2-04 TaxID=3234199 RepID=UPI00384DB927